MQYRATARTEVVLSAASREKAEERGERRPEAAAVHTIEGNTLRTLYPSCCSGSLLGGGSTPPPSCQTRGTGSADTNDTNYRTRHGEHVARFLPPAASIAFFHSSPPPSTVHQGRRCGHHAITDTAEERVLKAQQATIAAENAVGRSIANNAPHDVKARSLEPKCLLIRRKSTCLPLVGPLALLAGWSCPPVGRCSPRAVVSPVGR